MTDLQRAANDAIFVLQLNTQDAIRYIVKHLGVNAREASIAVKNTVAWHKV